MFIYFLFQMILYHRVRHMRYFLLPFAGLYEHLVCYRVSRLIIVEKDVTFLPFRMINDVMRTKFFQVIDISLLYNFIVYNLGVIFPPDRHIYMFKRSIKQMKCLIWKHVIENCEKKYDVHFWHIRNCGFIFACIFVCQCQHSKFHYGNNAAEYDVNSFYYHCCFYIY